MNTDELDTAIREGVVQREAFLDQVVRILTDSVDVSKDTRKTIEIIEGNRKLVMEEYIKHLDGLREDNRKLMAVLKSQQATIGHLQQELKEERLRNNSLVDRLILHQQPSVQVNQK